MEQNTYQQCISKEVCLLSWLYQAHLQLQQINRIEIILIFARDVCTFKNCSQQDQVWLKKRKTTTVLWARLVDTCLGTLMKIHINFPTISIKLSNSKCHRYQWLIRIPSVTYLNANTSIIRSYCLFYFYKTITMKHYKKANLTLKWNALLGWKFPQWISLDLFLSRETSNNALRWVLGA